MQRLRSRDNGKINCCTAETVPTICHEPIQIAAAILGNQDRSELQTISTAYGWTTNVYGSLEEAVETLDGDRNRLLIYDRDVARGDWRKTIEEIINRYPSTCILLASSVRDQYLWDEVIRRGGYDVVLKPFRRDELRRVINFASTWMEWSAVERTRVSHDYK